MEGNVRMTIVSAVAIHPRSGEVWDDLQKQLKKAMAIVKKHGAENVTLLVTVIGGPQTNALTMLTTAENWTRFGQIQEAVYGDPKMQALLAETGKIATWEIYTAQTLELWAAPRKRASALAIPVTAALALVLAGCALPFASAAHTQAGTLLVPRSGPCNLQPSDRDLIIWNVGRTSRTVPLRSVTSTGWIASPPLMIGELGSPPDGPGYCSKIAWASDNPGYDIELPPALPLKKVIDEVGDG
jgi:hypothetical protein